MSGWDIACIGASAGWVVSLLALVTLLFADVGYRKWASSVLVFIVLLGFVTCATEDKICNVADKQ